MAFLDLRPLISTEPFVRLIRETIALEDLRNSTIALRISTTDWNMGTSQVFENRHMTPEIGHDIIRASASIPGVFPFVYTGNTAYVDGSVAMDLPLMPALNADI